MEIVEMQNVLQSAWFHLGQC